MSISVIIPAYNVEKFILEAVDSVMKQTVLPDEVIIVNDGSTDGTPKLIDKYKNHEIVKVFTTVNRGLGAARNKGFVESSCDYIYYFDSDDILKDSFIENMLKIIEKNNEPEIILFSGESFVDENFSINTYMPDYSRGLTRCFDNSFDLISNLDNKKSLFPSACLYVSKRELWLKNKIMFKPIIHEDEEVLFKLLALSRTSCVVGESFFYRRIRKGSIMTTEKNIENIKGLMSSVDSMYQFRKEYKNLYETLKPYWERRVVMLAIQTFRLMTSLGIIRLNKSLFLSFYYVLTPKLAIELTKTFLGVKL